MTSKSTQELQRIFSQLAAKFEANSLEDAIKDLFEFYLYVKEDLENLYFLHKIIHRSPNKAVDLLEEKFKYVHIYLNKTGLHNACILHEVLQQKLQKAATVNDINLIDQFSILVAMLRLFSALTINALDSLTIDLITEVDPIVDKLDISRLLSKSTWNDFYHYYYEKSASYVVPLFSMWAKEPDENQPPEIVNITLK